MYFVLLRKFSIFCDFIIYHVHDQSLYRVIYSSNLSTHLGKYRIFKYRFCEHQAKVEKFGHKFDKKEVDVNIQPKLYFFLRFNDGI